MIKVDNGYRLSLNGQSVVDADYVILATPAFVTASLLAPLSICVEKLNKIAYVSVANVILTYDKKDVTVPLDGSGYVVPKREGRLITASTWTSSKWGHTAPTDKVVIRCYVGRQGHEEWMQLSDEELVAGVRRDIADLSGVAAEPLAVQINRWVKSMPQYPVGHLDVLDDVQQALAKDVPGVLLAGAAYYGVGLPDCVQQGQAAARKIFT
jgi:oxygen-dependent protoporphyrinogen oxidase